MVPRKNFSLLPPQRPKGVWEPGEVEVVVEENRSRYVTWAAVYGIYKVYELACIAYNDVAGEDSSPE